MVLNISWLFTPWILFLVAIILVGAGIVVLIILEKNLNKKLVVHKKKKEDDQFQVKIDSIMKLKDTQKILEALDETARAFFRNKLGIDTTIEYSDLVKTFQNKGDDVAMRFCERIQEAIYSGEVLNRKKLDYLAKNFLFLLRREQKKEEGLRKNAPKASWMRNIFGGRKEDPMIRQKVDLEKPGTFRTQEVNQKVVAYIEEGLRRGFKISLLKQKLIGGGFKEIDVEDAIKHIESQERERIRAKENNSSLAPQFDHKLVELLIEGLKKNLDDIALKKSILKKGYDEVTAKRAIEYSKELTMIKNAQPKIVVQKEVVEVKHTQEKETIGESKPLEKEDDSKIIAMLVEGKKRGFDMELVKKKLISRGIDAKSIDAAMRKLEHNKAKKTSWFGRLFGSDEKKEITKNKESDEGKIIAMLVEGKKRGFDMELVKKKLISRGIDAKSIDAAMRKLEIKGSNLKDMKEDKNISLLAKENLEAEQKNIPVKVERPVEVKENPKKLKVVPYKKEEIKHRKVSKSIEKEIHKFVGSMDDLERVKKKISQRDNVWASRVNDEDVHGLV